MRPSDRNARAVLALLVAACCVAAVGFAAPTGAQSPAVPQTDDQPSPDNTITRIDLAADGSATWEVTLRTRLENDSDVAEYERFQERFRSNTSRYLDPFAERMSGVVSAANDSADREMRATEFEAETGIQEVPRRWGVVTFRFTWTGFAAVDGDAVVAGDVFAGGFFIDDDDALAVSAPEGYAVESADPEPDEAGDGVVEWRGREDFGDGRPRVRAVPATGGSGDDTGADGESAPDVGGPPLLSGLGALLLVGAVGVGAYAVRSDRIDLGGAETDDGEKPEGGPTDDDGRGGDGPDPTSPAANAGAAGGSAAGTAGSADTDSDSDLEDAATVAETADDGTDAIDPELLTDEDRIRRALRERGGRMKQSAIVEEFDWSKSKTSRVLSRMADAGEVEKLRIGRENVIDLADADDPVDPDTSDDSDGSDDAD
ncbi:hypothetical protein CK500_01345 [Halorubrum salipaludis]|uniref:MarR family transcriptional regulator n=1 Tax=Halorubrum salipaludis TaxID=2032630 RepID=A0A2A2FL99_9EURY|nr:hypothetical protein [Halorubrum salipaludis]PAU85343.1 hypothetical protein CK500_01345 [Halorubrum salipaludis]